jgi:acetoin utilization protein AcuC
MDRYFISNPIFFTAEWNSNHPLAIARQAKFYDFCQVLGWLFQEKIFQCNALNEVKISEIHDYNYVITLKKASEGEIISSEERLKYNICNFENPIFQGVYDRATASVGGSVAAAEVVLNGGTAFHPAGGTHHGKRAKASGFCYFNDPVFAIKTFIDNGFTRIAYVDLDAHHGDGVEEFYKDDERVFLSSIHEENRWPYSGKLADNKKGRIVNIPVLTGINDDEYKLVIDALYYNVCKFAPQAIVITAGADCLGGDPLSKMEISNVAFWDAIQKFCSIAPSRVVLGGGGYNPWTVTRAWAGLWAKLNDFDIPKKLPHEIVEMLKTMSCDLVDNEDIKSEWLNSISDVGNSGDIRTHFVELSRVIRDFAD